MKSKYTKTQNESGNPKKCTGHGNSYQYANQIDAVCRRRLGDNVIMKGVLAGRESEIRQEALLMLMSGFLAGNPRFSAAIKANNAVAIAFEIERSTAIALSKCKKRLASYLTHVCSVHVQISERNGGSCNHPYDRHIHEWMPDTRIKMVLSGLKTAVKAKQLSEGNAKLVTMIIKDGRSITEVAAQFRVSSNAIYQRLRRVRKVLPELLSRLDP